MAFRFSYVVLGSLLLLGALVMALTWGPDRVDLGNEPLHLYCAAGVRLPVQKAIAEYTDRYGIEIETTFDGSGKLLALIEAGERGDLYLAADRTYIEQGRSRGLCVESVELASQRPCVAVPVGSSITSLEELASGDIKVSIAEPKLAAVGRVAKRRVDQFSGSTELWDRIYQNADVKRHTVNEVANDIKSGIVDAGIIWDATAAQYEKLAIVRVPHFDGDPMSIGVSVLSTSEQPSRALHFMRFLSARDVGLKHFEQLGYEVVSGDAWADKPEVRLFTGGLMHPAIQQTIQEFEKREGVSVLQTPNGCGVLVSQIRAGEHPDAYFACDTSFMEMVEEVFLTSEPVSETEMVIILRPEIQAKLQIKDIESLAAAKIKLGFCDPQHSALGELTRLMLTDAGVWEQAKAKVVDWPSTADRLVEAVVIGGMDGAIVYRANTTRQAEKLSVVDIDIPASKAAQPIAVARDSRFPNLTQRLIDRLRSDESRRRFERLGFKWNATEGQSTNNTASETPQPSAGATE